MRGIELDCGDVRRRWTGGGGRQRRRRCRPGPAERLHQSDVGGAEPINLARWKGIEESVGAYIGSPISKVARCELAVVDGCYIGCSAIERKVFRTAGASLMNARSCE